MNKDSSVSQLPQSENLGISDLVLISKMEDNGYSSRKINIMDTVSSFVDIMGTELSDSVVTELSNVMQQVILREWIG